MLARIKKNDTVVVVSGRDKGKSGVVLRVIPKQGTVLVKGVGVVTRHKKAQKEGDVSGIISEERPVVSEKLMPVCSSCKIPCRTRSIVLDTGKRVRACGRCGAQF